MNRKKGYYWVKPFDDDWEVCYYDKDGWYSIWDGGSYTDFDYMKINENRLEQN